MGRRKNVRSGSGWRQFSRDNGLFGMFSRTFYRLGDFHYHYVHTLDTLKLRFWRPSQTVPNGQ